MDRTAGYIAVLLLCFLMGCSGSRELSLAPLKTFDPDNADIPPPRNLEENQIWDLIDLTGIYQIGKPLNLNWTAEKFGKWINLTSGRQADNVNALDEVPNSSWFTNRHFYDRMSISELKRGPNITTAGPDTSGPWLITRGKFEGGTPGFTIKDARGDRYIIKFDAVRYPEMGSSAEVISTKILYACGYNVPENTIAYFHPDQLEIGETAQVLDQGIKRPMTQADLQAMLQAIPRRADGRIRVLASKFVNGKPVGIWEYRGTRKDDPNDRVHHQHRRELRGLRVISSWLNDADRRAANTLAVYTKQNGRKFIQHYLIDMGSTLGSNNKFPHAPKYGYEYLTDPRTIFKSILALGLYVKPWEFIDDHLHPHYPAVGYFESELFDPGSWVPTYPNPAFERATLRDMYWGAKQVTAFTDAEIVAIVAEAQMSDPAAAAYLTRILIERRDKIGRYWFARMNPLDKFTLSRSDAGLRLVFHDLAVDTGLESAATSQYVYRILYQNRAVRETATVEDGQIPLADASGASLATIMKPGGKERDKIFQVEIRTRRHNSPLSKSVSVFIYFPGKAENARIIAIQREE